MFNDARLEVVHSMADASCPRTEVKVYALTGEDKKVQSESVVYRNDIRGEHTTPFIMSFDDKIEVDGKFAESLRNNNISPNVRWDADNSAIVLKAYLRDMNHDDCVEWGKSVYQALREFDSQH